MTDQLNKNGPELRSALLLDELCERFEQEWKFGHVPELRSFLKQLPGVGFDRVFAELLAIELEYRFRAGDNPRQEEYRTRFPEHADQVDDVFAESRRRVQAARNEAAPAALRTTTDELCIRCPHCRYPIKILGAGQAFSQSCPVCGSSVGATLDKSRKDGEAGPTDRLIGHFRLIEQIGEGAFGTVWKAIDEITDRIVAVKTPRIRHLSSEELDRFVREARSAARCHHPGIVTVFEVGYDGGLFFIVSQFIEGPSLQQVLAQVAEHRLPPAEAARLCMHIAEALDHAHAVGVVHRDLKPANILLDAERNPHITDFGLAKRETGELAVTQSGVVLGTLEYMSPEQARGDLKSVDRRSDIYSLGTILFELLTGEKPFRGTTETILRQVQETDPPSVCRLNPQVQRDLETVCLRCLEKEPRLRFATARDLAEDLRRCLERQPTRSRPIGRLERIWRWCKRHPSIVAILGLTVVSLSCLGVVGRFTIKQASKIAPQSHSPAASVARGTRRSVGPPRAVPAKTRIEEDFSRTVQGQLPVGWQSTSSNSVFVARENKQNRLVAVHEGANSVSLPPIQIEGDFEFRCTYHLEPNNMENGSHLVVELICNDHVAEFVGLSQVNGAIVCQTSAGPPVGKGPFYNYMPPTGGELRIVRTRGILKVFLADEVFQTAPFAVPLQGVRLKLHKGTLVFSVRLGDAG